MKYVSTRGKSPKVSFSEAVAQGLAPDGGLYVPERFPEFQASDFYPIDSLPRLAERLLRPFLAGDVLEPALEKICREAFNFPLPLRRLKEGTSLLELFHGPTAAFKDVGARFLAHCFRALDEIEKIPHLILVATSGDTGSAVAAAFYRQAKVKVGILFPQGGVSERQEKLLSCWGENIQSFRVQGSFDDCQQLVKGAFQDEGFRRGQRLSSANSINIGRLLPQMVYYASSSLEYFKQTGKKPGFVIPTGNMGNAVAAFWARRVGFPLRVLALATNENAVIPRFFATGNLEPVASRKTLANAMDVGHPSNMERLLQLFPKLDELKAVAQARAVTDKEIQKTIQTGIKNWGCEFCPHTATAVYFREQLPTADWIIVATAHPAKFDTVVEPLIGRKIGLPEPLEKLLRRPCRVQDIRVDLGELRAGLGV